MVRTKGDMKQPSKAELRRQLAEALAFAEANYKRDADPEGAAFLAERAAYERGAREFAEWMDASVQTYSFENYAQVVPRFLTSRGTGIAEGKKEG